MSLVGDLEFKTKIDDKPAIIKMPNACLDINVSSENGHREISFSIDSDEHRRKSYRKIIFTIEMLDSNEEEELMLLFLHFIKNFDIIFIE